MCVCVCQTPTHSLLHSFTHSHCCALMAACCRAQMEEYERQMAFQANENQAPQGPSTTVVSAHEVEKQKKETLPHFSNLNEDPALSRIINHFVEEKEVVVGQDEESAAASGGEDDHMYIHVTGFGIRKRHVVVTQDGSGNFFIEAGSPASKTRVNGKALEGKMPLRHNDRLQLGTNSIFLFVNPTNKEMSPGSPEQVDYEFAQEEIAKASGLFTEGGDAEEKERMSQILELFPMVAEVNAISEEMDKKMQYSVALVNDMMIRSASTSDRTQVMVKVINTANDNEWLMDRGEFVDRRYQIQEMFGDWAYDHDTSAAVYGPPRSDVSRRLHVCASACACASASTYVCMCVPASLSLSPSLPPPSVSHCLSLSLCLSPCPLSL